MVKNEGEKRETERLIREERIAARVKELAAEVASDYEGKEAILVGALKGSYILLADLQRELFRLGMDWPVDFMGLSSYDSNTESSRNPRITKDLDMDIFGRHVLLVEDIVDTGWSLEVLKRLLGERGPKSLKTLALLSKPGRREVEVDIDYLGFEVDGWVEGYGLDSDQKGRGNPEIIRIVGM